MTFGCWQDGIDQLIKMELIQRADDDRAVYCYMSD